MFFMLLRCFIRLLLIFHNFVKKNVRFTLKTDSDGREGFTDPNLT